PHLFGAGMHHDGSRSAYGWLGGARRILSFGHKWVLLSVRVPCPWNPDRGWAVPILFRLYRNRKSSPKAEYKKRSELAVDLLDILTAWLPEDRRLHLTGDRDYACQTVVRTLPAGLDLTGPVPLDAALYKRPGRSRPKGRPRRKGQRLPNPKRIAARKRRGWRRISLILYGKSVTLCVWSRVCLWYTVARSRPVRVVVTKDPKGRAKPKAYFCTDPARSVEEILQTYAQRWDLEVAIRNAKQMLGLEDPQNGFWRRKHGYRSDTRRPGPHPRGRRGEQAVKHTVPLVFVAYALILVWYLRQGDRTRDVATAKRAAPWYRHKREPAFADMLAALRRDLWVARLSRNPDASAHSQKLARILPLWALAA
ncbi:MAG: IS701 family transposase, partial [Planctomycetota bacterium]